jgi:predicted nucleic acid-binding protein
VKLLLDINVVMDVFLLRVPFVLDSAPLLAAVDDGKAEGYVAAHTVTTAYYLIAKNQGVQNARAAVAELLRMLRVVPAERADLHQALGLGWSDFEDAVQAVCASKVGADFIVTRDLQDFRASPIPAHEPAYVLSLL